MLEIAGLLVSGISLANDLFQTFRDMENWKEEDISVDREWLSLALSKSVIPDVRYTWSLEKHLPTRKLQGTHDVVMAYDAAKKIKYRIVQGSSNNRLVLTTKLK